MKARVGMAKARPVAHEIDVHSKGDKCMPLTVMLRCTRVVYLQIYQSNGLLYYWCYIYLYFVRHF